MHIKTANDTELTQAMADAIQRVGEGCTKAEIGRASCRERVL